MPCSAPLPFWQPTLSRRRWSASLSKSKRISQRPADGSSEARSAAASMLAPRMRILAARRWQLRLNHDPRCSPMQAVTPRKGRRSLSGSAQHDRRPASGRDHADHRTTSVQPAGNARPRRGRTLVMEPKRLAPPQPTVQHVRWLVVRNQSDKNAAKGVSPSNLYDAALLLASGRFPAPSAGQG